MQTKRFKLKPETIVRYSAEHEAHKANNAPRRALAIQSEINDAIRDNESASYIAYLKAKLP